LRLVKEGVNFEEFRRRFGRDFWEIYGSQTEELLELGLLEKSEGGVRLSPRGRLLGNEVFQRFL